MVLRRLDKGPQEKLVGEAPHHQAITLSELKFAADACNAARGRMVPQSCRISQCTRQQEKYSAE